MKFKKGDFVQVSGWFPCFGKEKTFLGRVWANNGFGHSHPGTACADCGRLLRVICCGSVPLNDYCVPTGSCKRVSLELSTFYQLKYGKEAIDPSIVKHL